ncbi:S41 family peptidase [Lutibacter sp.]|uniref:S41 family peptidase n=1 Tax=Lutibacter sp. TaxID=1925666 RepID=UPI0027333FF9|nr:S41 family peptidase [Lutibacter sp.]MDP3313851.1 S41 family peptidase [Lutibacter sp.]
MSKIKKIIIGFFGAITIMVSVGFQSDFFEIAKQIDIYTTLFKELNRYYIDEVNPAKITNQAINNMLQNLDPYTRYYDEQNIEDARIEATGDFGSIGAITLFKNKKLSVREIIKNSPAENSGIKPGDNIIKINDVLVKDFDEKGAAMLLNGVPNSTVNLQIERLQKMMEFTVIRKKVEENPVPYSTMLDAEVGYIAFTTFNAKASSEIKKAMEALKDQGMKKLIIDVRGNPGGLLMEAVKITNFFIPKGKTVVTTKAKFEKWSETFKTNVEPIEPTIPIAILINYSSASASEILAGSLQDYDRAVIVGQRSFGKGLVQRFLPLSYGTQMKITISKYYTPSGRCIQELDYTNRDEKGTVPKFSDVGREKLKTENGRIVYGGGGILPDVESATQNLTKTTETLLNSDALFNYVTDYFYNNKTIAEPSKFNLNESSFVSLERYLINNHSNFETETELEFKKAFQKATLENLNKNTTISYENLLKEIQSEKMKELVKNKTEITHKLTEEIVKRYYNVEGVYKQKVAFDTTIIDAMAILNNQKKYQSILKN